MINTVIPDERVAGKSQHEIRSRVRSSLSADTCMAVMDVMEALDAVSSVREFYQLVQRDLRQLLPHDMTCFCIGEWTVDKSFKTHNMVGVDWPENGFNEILAYEDMSYLFNTQSRMRGGIVGNYFDIEGDGLLCPNGGFSTAATGQRAIRNLYVQSIISPQASKSIYHCFANNRVAVDARFRRIVKILIPYFNKAVFRLTEQASPASRLGITEREMCVLRYLTLGYKNRNIAEELNISIHTVKNHITNILSKLQVANRTQAVTRALELRLSNSLMV